MNDRQKAKRSWFVRWRENRRAKDQQAVERERARAAESGSSSRSTYPHGASGGGWLGFGGGDGGGCGGGDGGGC